jgi:hypothetical protein
MGRKLITHNGGNGIFSADFRWFPDDGVVICALTNLSNFSPVDYVTRDLTRLMFGADVDLPPATVTLEPAVLEPMTGTYQLETGGSIEVQARKQGLLLTGSGVDAETLLTGGSGGGTSPRVAALKAKSEDILRREYGGDFTGIHEALGGQMSLEEITAEETGWMEMREERYGAFQDLEAVAAVAGGKGLSVFVRIAYQRGVGFIQYVWEGNALVGIELVSSAPVPEVTVWPTSTTEFQSFSLSSPVSVRVEFEVPPDSTAPTVLLIDTDDGPVRAFRR